MSVQNTNFQQLTDFVVPIIYLIWRRCQAARIVAADPELARELDESVEPVLHRL
ncbi:hypothetical protein EG329_005753 [Mollisiaceae sp. DMI_Dod_QoI]|nr:hypothetical protein EG329_005753 [Helotiales sp. DMI_Dod_QoI]